jgi:uncharacterized protein with PIN domain
MPRTIRFHLDEHISEAIAGALRRQGADVTTTSDANLGGATDEEHIAFALPEARVIVTRDDDYLRLAASGVEHAGVAFWSPKKRSVGDAIRGLLLIWEELEPVDMHNHVEFL